MQGGRRELEKQLTLCGGVSEGSPSTDYYEGFNIAINDVLVDKNDIQGLLPLKFFCTCGLQFIQPKDYPESHHIWISLILLSILKGGCNRENKESHNSLCK